MFLISISACKGTKKNLINLKKSKKKCRKCLFFEKKHFFCTLFVENWDNHKIFCNFAGRMVKSILLHNKLMDFSRPRVMAIVNLSDDSFFISFDMTNEAVFLQSIEQLIRQGADILDIGACSTRPNSSPVSAAKEWSLLQRGLSIVRHYWTEIPISVDTFRAEIAERAVAYGADIINDVSGAKANPMIFDVVAKHHLPYILTHAQPITLHAMAEVLHFLQQQLDMLHQREVVDVIIDPGFGFGKTIEQNYTLLNHLDVLQTLNAPVLVGISRKSMLYKPLNTIPDNVLAATVAANTLALQRGANILRVHDVEAARQAIQIYQLTNPAHNPCL